MRRSIIIIVGALLFLLSGCTPLKQATQIETLGLVRTLGLDSAGDGQTGLSVAAGEKGGDIETFSLYSFAESATMAIERAQSFSDKRQLYYAHTGYVILGERAALSAADYFDFLERNIDIRLATPIFVMKHGDARPVVTAAEPQGSDVTSILSSIERQIEGGSSFKLYTLADIARGLSENGAALCLSLREEESTQGGKTLVPDGYAIIKGGSLLGYLSGEGAAGVAVIEGAEGDFSLGLPGGSALRVTRLSCGVSPIMEEGRLCGLRLQIKARAGIEELGPALSGTQEEISSALARACAEELCSRAAYVAAALRETEADFCGLGQRLLAKQPELRGQLSSGWLGEMRFEISAEVETVFDSELILPQGAKGGA